jgi:hypothetical protein
MITEYISVMLPVIWYLEYMEVKKIIVFHRNCFQYILEAL